MLSIIIPTFNEKENVLAISHRIQKVLGEYAYELVFVDDSRDETPKILETLSKQDPHVRYEHRKNERGLGTAVVRGFELAQGDTVTVMDADLQHPPEMLIPMLGAIEAGADIVIPSRFIPGGDDGGLNIVRKVISAGARYLGKLFLKVLRPINDPTSGYFMFKKSVITGVVLQPIGWKILIEVLARGKYSRVTEIPYRFQPRAAGESKMSFTEQWNYIKHLFTLWKDSPEDRRFYWFALIGLSGVLVNMIIYNLLVEAHVNVMLAGTLSALCAMLSNFFFNDRFTWSDAKVETLKVRALKFITTSLVGIGINIFVLTALYEGLHLQYLWSNFIGIIAGTVWNYAINNVWTWRTSKKSHEPDITQWSPNKLNSTSVHG